MVFVFNAPTMTQRLKKNNLNLPYVKHNFSNSLFLKTYTLNPQLIKFSIQHFFNFFYLKTYKKLESVTLNKLKIVVLNNYKYLSFAYLFYRCCFIYYFFNFLRLVLNFKVVSLKQELIYKLTYTPSPFKVNLNKSLLTFNFFQNRLVNKNSKFFNYQFILAFKRNDSSLKTSLDVKKNYIYFFKKINIIQLNFFLLNLIKKKTLNNFKCNFNGLRKNSKFTNFLQYEKKLKNSFLVNFRTKWFRTFYNNRLVLGFFLNKLNKSQNRFTKFISPLLKFKIYKNLRILDLNLTKVLIMSKFSVTENHSNFLIKSGCVFINGKIKCNNTTVIKENDTIQLIFFRSYFLYWIQLNQHFHLKISKIKKYFFNINKNRYNFFKNQKIKHPVWFLNYSFINTDVPHFLDIDYTTLTITHLYQPKKIFDFNYQTYKLLNLHLIRMYNWKYTV